MSSTKQISKEIRNRLDYEKNKEARRKRAREYQRKIRAQKKAKNLDFHGSQPLLFEVSESHQECDQVDLLGIGSSKQDLRENDNQGEAMVVNKKIGLRLVARELEVVPKIALQASSAETSSEKVSAPDVSEWKVSAFQDLAQQVSAPSSDVSEYGGEQVEVSDSFDFRVVIMKSFSFIVLALTLAGSTILVVSENIARFEAAGIKMPLLLAAVLELAIVSLSFLSPKLRLSFSTKASVLDSLKVSAKFVGLKLILASLVCFSLSTSVVSDKVNGVEKIAAVSDRGMDQNLEKRIQATTEALIGFQKKGESGNIRETQRILDRLSEQKEKMLGGAEISALKKAYSEEQFINMAAKAIPLLISIVFAHLLGRCFRREVI